MSFKLTKVPGALSQLVCTFAGFACIVLQIIASLMHSKSMEDRFQRWTDWSFTHSLFGGGK